MALKPEEKRQIIELFKRHETDTGSPEVQLGLLLAKIRQMELHYQKHPKDYQTHRSLLRLYAKRRKLINYIKRKYPLEVYRRLQKMLNVR